MKEREKFGSRLGFILVSAGCAIGLGNVWKFPYICGQYGGAAFIVIYLIFLAILGLPILVSEFAVGRGSGKGMGCAFEELEPKGTKWHWLKWVSILGCYLLMMFYTMVGGWMLNYTWKMASGQMTGISPEEVSARFNGMLGSAPEMLGWMLVTILLAFGVCALGFQKGVEKISKFMMSALIIIMVGLAIRSIFLPGAMEGVKFYLVPDFKLVVEYGIGTVVYAAMSQAFFTLSIGIGAMAIFGSYQSRERALAGEAVNIILLDTFVALSAGFIVIPACFAYGINPDAGPSLLFITLPTVFNNMAGGKIFGTLFFLFMSFAAFTTIIAVFENIVSYYMDMKGMERKKAVAINVVLITLLSIPAVLGFNVWSDIQLLGEGSTIMDVEDFLVSYNLLPLGSMIFVLFCVKKNGWGWEKFVTEVNTGKGLKFSGSKVMRIYMTYILPLIIAAVYLKGYYDMFAPKGEVTLKGIITLAGWMAFAVILLLAIMIIMLKKPSQKKS
ncbi:MAG: sodium-dependent transporter [Lachnospiraceae bacterium]|nr:sodium-dependent transporter [Lachnospiraceae bacterium]